MVETAQVKETNEVMIAHAVAHYRKDLNSLLRSKHEPTHIDVSTLEENVYSGRTNKTTSQFRTQITMYVGSQRVNDLDYRYNFISKNSLDYHNKIIDLILSGSGLNKYHDITKRSTKVAKKTA